MKIRMGSLTPQIAILLSVERINFNNDVAVIIVDHFRLSVVGFRAALVQFDVPAVFLLLRRFYCDVWVAHHVVRGHTTHALGIKDLAVGVGVELGPGLNNFVGTSIDERPIKFLRRRER